MDEGWQITLPNRSLVVGSPLTIKANRSLASVSVQINRVEDHEENWVLSSPLEVDSAQATVGHCRAVGNQPPGLYWLTALNIPDRPQAISALLLQPPMLFEIRASPEMPRSIIQLQDAYNEIIRQRQERRETGIGSGPVAASVLIFVKDLLTTTYLNLITCEIMPLEPVGWTAEVQAINRLLETRGAPNLPMTEEVLDQIRRAEPTTLIQFPTVRSNSLAECGELAIREASLLVTLLASRRGSLGEVFCTIIHEPKTGDLLSDLYLPQYRGNLLGGFLSGEQPEGLRRDLHAIRSDTTLQLFVMLLGEAIRERRSDFKYVRLWSLLETVAKSRGCAGRPKRDWGGQLQVGRRGQQLFIQDAAELVYELLRELLPPRGIAESSFAGSLTYGTLQEQIQIWYRRRNCTAHGDPDCVCHDPSKASAAGVKYSNCYRARNDDQNGHDGYISALQEVARIIIFSLLQKRWPA